MRKNKALKPPSTIDAFKLLVGAVASLAGVVIFYLSISDAAAEGSDYESQFYEWTFHTAASTYPGLAMLLCGLCLLFEVASSNPDLDLSQTRIACAWPAINSSLMLVCLYNNGVTIFLVNIAQTVGIILVKVKLVLPKYYYLATRSLGYVIVALSMIPLIVALSLGRHWHVILVVTLYLVTVSVWSVLGHLRWVELACEAVNVMCIPWLTWSLFSVTKGHDLPPHTVTI